MFGLLQRRSRRRRLATGHRQSLKALGLAYLVLGDVNRAVPVLEEAADRPRPDAHILSDLSAAYLARATRNSQPQDFANALTAAERAVKLDPGLAEGWFNRACALERLSLSEEARQAWQDYLKVDDRSGWAEEARNRMKAAGAPPQSGTVDDDRRAVERVANGGAGAATVADIVKTSPQAVREWAEHQLLVVWPRLILSGRFSEAGALVFRIKPLTDVLARERDDAFLAEALSVVIRVSTDERRARSLASAHQKYQAASDASFNDHIVESTKLIQDVLAPLDEAHSPFAESARRLDAVGSYYANDLTGALTKATAVVAYAKAHRDSELRGLAYRLQGLVHVVQGEFASALDSNEAALKCFQVSGDLANEASIQSSLAENFQLIGATDQAWQAHFAALSRIGTVRERNVRHVILQGASIAALRDDMPEVALHLQQAALDNAYQWGRPPAVITGHITRAQIYSRLSQPQGVALDLLEAHRYARNIQDPLLVARNEARILLASGETAARERPDEAIETLSSALSYFERTGTSWPLASVYLARGRAQLAAHRDQLAEQDFLAGIQVFERMRSSLTSESLRTSYFEQPWDLFSEMIRLQVTRGNPGRALVFAEQARARTLLEAIDNRNDAAPAAPAAVQKLLPRGVAVLYYAALDDRLLIWLLTADRQDFVETSVRQADVTRILERYHSDAGSDLRNTSSLMALYDVLIRPIQAHLPDRNALLIVPDGVLHAVPFAALIRREDHRYLVEDHALATSPSLTIIERSIAQRAVAVDGLTRALVLGDPQVGVEGLARLPEASREAREIANLYSHPDLLTDSDATKARFIDSAGSYEVVHFAGHGISNDEYPSLSRLLLAGVDESSRSLFAQDIARMRFDRTQLVVLAACRTSTGRIRRGEGVLSLARPFIAAGVPTVVATLWDVDDRTESPPAGGVSSRAPTRRAGGGRAALRATCRACRPQPDPSRTGELGHVHNHRRVAVARLLECEGFVRTAITPYQLSNDVNTLEVV